VGGDLMTFSTTVSGVPLQWFGASFAAAALASGVLLTFLLRARAFQPVRGRAGQIYRPPRHPSHFSPRYLNSTTSLT
jgi:hypothetical protein